MKKLIISLCCLFISADLFSQQWVRVNQLGYLPEDIKVAVYIASSGSAPSSFQVCEAVTDSVVFEGNSRVCGDASKWGFAAGARLDFSSLRKSGGYYVLCGNARSPVFPISAGCYDGSAEFLLKFMREQQCGYNPVADTLCHQNDGYIVDHPTRSGEKIDVRGGWHDAADYLQYVKTSATATYQMLFAYMEIADKSVFRDEYDDRGRRGANGIPDILDQAKWGLDWLDKMNPSDKVMFFQIADDRDHIKFTLPQDDRIDYGWGPGKGRPVYFLTGRPQGLGKYVNRTTGVSSTAGKFASAFALGARIFRNYDKSFADRILRKSEDAYKYAEEDLGNTQTCCLVSPYFYEEDNYADDLELASATDYSLSGDPYWLGKAEYWGELEHVSPWIVKDTARHYQSYPFINLGHYLIASSSDNKARRIFSGYMKKGLEMIRKRSEGDPFMNGLPYLWCSNNFLSAAVTQASLYYKITKDSTYMEMESALRDWLFGCNPWGTSMIVGYPQGAEDVPLHPQSGFLTFAHKLPYGGLVDGPVYKSIFDSRAGNSLHHADAYAPFNKGIAVYHDDSGDYASNEPTIDGTAGLCYYLASREEDGNRQKKDVYEKDGYGAVIRINPHVKNIYLVFTADSNFTGASRILRTLKRNRIKGSFFLTGNCLAMPEHAEIIRDIIRGGNYVGGHSGRHLLYATWGNRDSLIVPRSQIIEDIKYNASELLKFGITRDESEWFLPPYEYYNAASVNIIKDMGYKVINYTPGTATPADYTTPEMKHYRSSQELIDKLYSFEWREGLDGAVLLIHPGIDKRRTDKLYNRLDEVVRYLKRKGYVFKTLK
ncbi:MAG: glycoside hydrolase family 9 protein [Bacteroidales bacterium]|nr:glycoside hydrolase family 9 protein [Bacteroidales bacterium]